METVGDVMQRPGPSVKPHDTVQHCLNTMMAQGSKYVMVVDREGTFHTLISERMLRPYSRHGEAEVAVREIDRADGHSCGAADDVIRVLARQLADRRDATAVVDSDGRPVGLLTEADALHLAQSCLQPWMAVSDLVRTQTAVHVAPTDNCAVAVAHMQRFGVRRALVLEGETLCGAVSELELLGREDRDVRSVLPRIVRTIDGTELVSKAVPRLLVAPSQSLPVLDGNGELSGLLTPRVIVRALTAQLIASSTVPPPPRR